MSQQQRVEMTHSVLMVMHRWDLDREVQLALIGLPEGTRPRVLKRFQDGEPLPPDDRILERVGLLLQIEQALVSLFPHNPVMANLWVTTPSPSFDGHSPVDMMLADGVPAMKGLLDQLDGNCW